MLAPGPNPPGSVDVVPYGPRRPNPVPAPSDAEIRRRYGLAPDAAVRRHGATSGRLALDTFHVVTPTPAVEWASWDCTTVVAGSTAGLVVRTSFVGQGAPLTVALKDARNRTVGSGRGVVYGDAARVEVPVRRDAARSADGSLVAADVGVPDLGLSAVSGPLLVLPFAELTDARWGQDEAREGDVVTLACRLSGTAEGVERVGREPAEVVVLRGTPGDDVFEPVATLTARPDGGRIEAAWRVGFDAEGKARLATQAELDAAAPDGGTSERYAAPVYRFRVDLAGLTAESGPLAYQDWVEFSFTDADGGPYQDLGVTVERPDGERVEATADAEGRVRVEPAPPGPYHVVEVREPDGHGAGGAAGTPPAP